MTITGGSESTNPLCSLGSKIDILPSNRLIYFLIWVWRLYQKIHFPQSDQNLTSSTLSLHIYSDCVWMISSLSLQNSSMLFFRLLPFLKLSSMPFWSLSWKKWSRCWVLEELPPYFKSTLSLKFTWEGGILPASASPCFQRLAWHVCQLRKLITPPELLCLMSQTVCLWTLTRFCSLSATFVSCFWYLGPWASPIARYIRNHGANVQKVFLISVWSTSKCSRWPPQVTSSASEVWRPEGLFSGLRVIQALHPSSVRSQ